MDNAAEAQLQAARASRHFAFPNTSYAAPIGRSSLIVIAGALFGLRLVFQLGAGPFGDEAYYWMWGQHPALSYFDHPGANAWLLGLTANLGWTSAALRLGGIIASLATLPMFAYWARRLAGPGWPDYFLAATVIWLSSPLVFFFGAIAFSDYLLMFLALLSAHLFFLFFLDFEAGQPRFVLLYAAALVLGLAGLAKYVAALVGFAVAAIILLRPQLRPLLRRRHLYLAAFIPVALQTPTLAWNIANDFPSFRFHFGRLAGSFTLNSPLNGLVFLLINVVLVSPALVPALVSCLRRPPGEAGEQLWRLMAVALFALSTGFFLYESLRIWVLIYWNALAFVLFYPLAPLYLRSRRLFVSHVAIGLLFAILTAVNYAILPLFPFFGPPNADTQALYGWPQIAEQVSAAQTREHAHFVAATGYQLAAQLSFALRSDDVACTGRCNQFDFWRAADREGASAVLLAPDRSLDEDTIARFEHLDPIEAIAIERFGQPVITYRLYYGTGYRESR